MRQTNAAATMFHLKTCEALLQLHAEGAPLRFAVCHNFSSSFLRSGSSCVLYVTSFISSFVTLHYTRSQPGSLLQGMQSRSWHSWAIPGGMPCPSQAHATILNGFHYAPLRPSFTSVTSSPPAAFCCCARLAATGCVTGRRWHRSTLIRLTPYATLCPFTVCPSPPAKAGAFTGHPSRWHSQAIPSYLLHCL